MARAKRPTGPTPVDALKHQDKRSNIPTNELRGFVESDEAAPGKMLYPRDPSLDPQLVWRGKDEQDARDLEVPVVPIYIQEKILPQAIIENLRDTARKGEPEPEMTLFNDYDGLELPELVEFYRHEQNWANRMILGDSQLVMTSLAEKEGLKGKVQMIYMDPPYGIKFGSNWQVSTRKRDVKDGKAEDATRQPEQIKAFRDTWELGIHSYLAYLRDRLTVARELLTESGSIFVQIGDENVHLVRCVMDEVFGSENFISLITFRKTSGATGDFLPGTTDFLIWYSRSREHAKYRTVYSPKELGGAGVGAYTMVRLRDGSTRRMTPTERDDPSILPASAQPYRLDNLTSQSEGRLKGEGAASWFSVQFAGREFTPGMKARWKTNADGMARLLLADRIGLAGNTLSYIRYLDDFPAFPLNNSWEDTVVAGFGDPKVYVVQTNTKVVQRCMHMVTDPGDLVLDPTCGSGSTAVVAEQLGRRWITVDTSRVAMAVVRQRLMGAKYPYFLLADSPEGVRKESDLIGVPISRARHSHDVKQGFVYRRVPHITLKSIAQNPDIREGMSRAEIDAAIRRHADTELLYDQPYEDSSRIRVTGPFTVESLSPHRVLAGANGGDGGGPADEAAPARDQADFVTIILENLRKAGVQNAYRNERLIFDRIEPYAGTYVQAVGEYTDVAGVTQRAAISIGPEYGTVDSTWIKEAAKEARKGEGFPMLVVCAFAFGPYVHEETRQWPNLTILVTRMNPDLAMDTGDQKLLKTTGAGNLFMVFGEPDLELRTLPDRKLQVELHGLDVYDPTTGEIRSSSTDEIACWFIDTDYNEESFFVRHAYFTGADEPYRKLQRALKAEINEEAWASLYATVSRPFDAPSTGKIAVKVINHFGDEVLKVYEMPASIAADRHDT
ncbi:MAG TPA: site-specific DNA-methyltransferase [Thermoleophilia bacterium]|nr:site-specific DNA-methyltransferase [Thermoleophilia bacterium]